MDDLKSSFQQLFLHFYILSYAGDKKFDHNQFIRYVRKRKEILEHNEMSDL